MTRYLRFASALGPMFATAREGALTGVYFEGGRHAPSIDAEWIEAPHDEVLLRCAVQLVEYLAGRRDRFDLPLAATGTPFQQAVWREIARIPPGSTVSYAELARRAGFPRAARAAGAATGRNPHSIVVPCHRVVGSAGSLTGYAGGLQRKARLLALEAAGLGAAA